MSNSCWTVFSAVDVAFAIIIAPEYGAETKRIYDRALLVDNDKDECWIHCLAESVRSVKCPTRIIDRQKTRRELIVTAIPNSNYIRTDCIRGITRVQQAKQHARQLRRDKPHDSSRNRTSLVIQRRRLLILQEGTARFAHETVGSSDQDCWWIFGRPCQDSGIIAK